MENLLTWQKNFDPGRKAGKLTADLHLSLLQIHAPSLIPSSLADHLLQPPRSIFSGSHRFPADSKSSKDHTDSKHPSPPLYPSPSKQQIFPGNLQVTLAREAGRVIEELHFFPHFSKTQHPGPLPQPCSRSATVVSCASLAPIYKGSYKPPLTNLPPLIPL